MKRELIVITNIVYPIPSATGNISLRILEHLKQKFNIRIIALQDSDHVLYGKNINNNKVYTVTSIRWKWYTYFAEKKNESTGFERVLYNIAWNALRAIGKIDSMFIHLDNRSFYYKKSLHLLNLLNSETPADVVLSVSSPIESHQAAYKFKQKHPNVEWISYWGDLFSGSNYRLNVFVSTSRLKSIERDLLLHCDKVITTYEIFENSKEYFVDKDRIRFLPYTLNNKILFKNQYNMISSRNNLKCIIMGSLNNKMRDPTYMLDLFVTFEDVKLYLYTSGCDDLILSYSQRYPEKIIFKGRIKYDELINELMSANVLVNISNSVATSFPSKILELISFRKPIIDFYYQSNQESILERYPLCLRINMNESSNDSCQKIIDFFQQLDDRSIVSVDYIKRNYSEFSEEKEINVIKETFSV